MARPDIEVRFRDQLREWSADRAALTAEDHARSRRLRDISKDLAKKTSRVDWRP